MTKDSMYTFSQPSRNIGIYSALLIGITLLLFVYGVYDQYNHHQVNLKMTSGDRTTYISPQPLPHILLSHPYQKGFSDQEGLKATFYDDSRFELSLTTRQVPSLCISSQTEWINELLKLRSRPGYYEWFGLTFEGYVQLSSQDRELTIESDNGYTLTLEDASGKQLIFKRNLNEFYTDRYTLDIVPGWYKIRIDYFNGYESFHLRWSTSQGTCTTPFRLSR